MRVVRGMAAALVAMTVVAGSPAAAQDTAAPAEKGGALDGERAFAELERLQAEVRMLRALAGAQEALLAWNRERAESGAGPAVLPEALCSEPGMRPWCRTLTETFGAEFGRVAADGERETKR